MELRHIRYFIAVAEELHFGRASRRLNISQPPLSIQMKALEGEIGVALLRHERRHVLLTRAGEVFLKEAREIIAKAEHARLLARSAAEEERGLLIVGCNPSLELNLIRGFRSAFARRFGGIRLIMHGHFTPEIASAVRDRRFDVGLVALPLEADGLTMTVIRREPFLVAMRERHPLAKHRRIPIPALSRYPFIWFNRAKNPPFYDHYLGELRQRGLEPRLIEEVDDRGSALSFVAQADGLALVSQSLSTIERKGIVYRRLIPPALFIEFAIVLKRDRPPKVAVQFAEMIQQLTGATGHADRAVPAV